MFDFITPIIDLFSHATRDEMERGTKIILSLLAFSLFSFFVFAFLYFTYLFLGILTNNEIIQWIGVGFMFIFIMIPVIRAIQLSRESVKDADADKQK